MDSHSNKFLTILKMKKCVNQQYHKMVKHCILYLKIYVLMIYVQKQQAVQDVMELLQISFLRNSKIKMFYLKLYNQNQTSLKKFLTNRQMQKLFQLLDIENKLIDSLLRNFSKKNKKHHLIHNNQYTKDIIFHSIELFKARYYLI